MTEEDEDFNENYWEEDHLFDICFDVIDSTRLQYPWLFKSRNSVSLLLEVLVDNVRVPPPPQIDDSSDSESIDSEIN